MTKRTASVYANDESLLESKPRFDAEVIARGFSVLAEPSNANVKAGTFRVALSLSLLARFDLRLRVDLGQSPLAHPKLLAHFTAFDWLPP